MCLLENVIVPLNNIFTDEPRWGDINSALCQVSPVQDLWCWDITHALKVGMEFIWHMSLACSLRPNHSFVMTQDSKDWLLIAWGFYTVLFCNVFYCSTSIYSTA